MYFHVSLVGGDVWAEGLLGLTTVRVPTISRGGSMLLSTSWLTKWAVMPTMDIMATMLRPREMRKVFARGAEVAIFGGVVLVDFVLDL